MWSPITLEELNNEIQESELKLNDELLFFWQKIKIKPEKWKVSNFENENEKFWVLAIEKTKVIWYNDIEEGFNISNYNKYGIINEYYCNQDELDVAVSILFKTSK